MDFQNELSRLKIVNIVVSGNLNQKISLIKLLKLGDIYSYDPDNYHGGYIQLSSARTTIYKSGKYIIPGVKDIDSISDLWSQLIEILTPFIDVSVVSPPSVSNIVALFENNIKINLIDLIKYLPSDEAEYEPEVFPGLVWRTKKGTVLIFSSGKLLFMGVKSIEDLHKLFNFTLEFISKFITLK